MFFKACFDVRCSSLYWKKMHETGNGQLSTILSTHPFSDKRMKDLEDLMPIVQIF